MRRTPGQVATLAAGLGCVLALQAARAAEPDGFRRGQAVYLAGRGVFDVVAVDRLERFHARDRRITRGLEEVTDFTVAVYALRRHGTRDEVALFVPVAEATATGLRPLLSRDQVRTLLAPLAPEEAPPAPDLPWREEYPRLVLALGSAEPGTVAGVYRLLVRRRAARPLIYGEVKLLRAAEALLAEELSAVERVPLRAATLRVRTAAQGAR